MRVLIDECLPKKQRREVNADLDDIEDLKPLMPAANEALMNVRAGEVIYVATPKA